MVTLDRFETLAGLWVRHIARKPKENPFDSPYYLALVAESGEEVVPFVLYWIQRGRGGYWHSFLIAKSRMNAVSRGSNVDNTHARWVAWGRSRGI